MQKTLIEFIGTLENKQNNVLEQAGSKLSIFKLTISQIQYINAVHDLGEPTITEIASKLKFSKASVTAGINKLVDLGYMVKTQSNEDRRVFHVSLTEKAGKVIQARNQALIEYEAFILAALSDDEAREFEAIITKLVKHFKQAF